MVSGTWSARAKSFFTGDGLHHLSKAMLQSGQAYYLSVVVLVPFFSINSGLTHIFWSVTIGVAIASTALILAPSVPGEIKPILGSVYFALSSAMACRVFRAVLLGIIKDPHINVSVVRPAATSQNDTVDNGTTSKHDKTGISSLVINVAVEMDTRADSYDGHTFWDRSSTGGDKRHDASSRC